MRYSCYIFWQESGLQSQVLARVDDITTKDQGPQSIFHSGTSFSNFFQYMYVIRGD